ncbi:hypothetical protein GCM10027431_09760 [Lysobacter rhizosphaerae]
MTDERSEIIKEISAERSAASAALSTQSKTIALGVLAIVWLLLGGTQATLTAKFACYEKPLLWVAIICVVSLVLDFLQYLFSLIESHFALKHTLDSDDVDEAGWEEGHILRKLATACFAAKLLTAAGAAFWLLTIMLSGLA